MLSDNPLFSYLTLKAVLEDPASQHSLLKEIPVEFNLDENVVSGRQKISTDLLSEIFLFCDLHGESSVAFNYGLISEAGSLGLLDYYLASCNSLENAIDELIRFSSLISHSESTLTKSLNVEGKTTVNCSADDESSRKNVLMQELFFATLISLITRLSNHNWPEKIEFPYASLSKKVYEILSKNGVQINLNAAAYSIILKSEQQQYQLLFNNPKTAALLKPELEQMLQEEQSSDSIIVEILDLFSTQQNIGFINQNKISEDLHTSESSLKRRLVDVGTSFSQLLSSFKREKALSLLSKNTFATEKISQLLGYGDRTSFERAFKLWTNLTPAQYTQQIQLAKISLENIKLTDINSLPTSPKICQQVLQLIQSENFEIPTLSHIIKTDPVLTGKLMGIANSAYYGGSNVTDINQAIIQVLGVGIVQNLVISMMCCKQLEIKNCPEFNLEEFWFQALATAEAVKQFTRLIQVQDMGSSNEFYLAALLHNIGRYTLVFLKPAEMNQFLAIENRETPVNTMNQSSAEQNQQLEVKIFGLSGCTIGALVLTHWGLPKSVCSLIRELDAEPQQQSKIAQFLNSLSTFVQYKIRHPGAEDIPIFFIEKLADLIDLENSQVNQILMKIINQFDDIEQISKDMFKT